MNDPKQLCHQCAQATGDVVAFSRLVYVFRGTAVCERCKRMFGVEIIKPKPAALVGLFMVLLMVCGCKQIAKRAEPVNVKLNAVDAHRAQLLASGWTVTSYNGAEHWCARGVAFRPPPTPPTPPPVLRMMVSRFAADTFDVVETANGDGMSDPEPMPRLPNVISLPMPEVPATVYSRRTVDGQDEAQWEHDPGIYSSNVVGYSDEPAQFLKWSIPQ